MLPGEAEKHIGEGCVSTTWLQLNLALLTLTAEEKYAAEIEKTAYNHLTGAENPQTGCVSYYTPLLGQKPYGCTVNCCVSSVPRGIGLMSQYARGYVDGQLTLFGYESGRFEARMGGKTVQMEAASDYPASGDIVLRILNETPVEGVVLLRKPDWATGFRASTGKDQKIWDQGPFSVVQGMWSKKTPLAVHFEMAVKHLEDTQNYPGRIGFRRGPQVLALDAKLNGLKDVKGVRFALPGAGKITAQKLTGIWAATPGFRFPATLNGQKRLLTLAPYADACQTEGVFTVWMER